MFRRQNSTNRTRNHCFRNIFSEAEKYFKIAIEGKAEYLGECNQDTVDSLVKLGTMYRADENPAAAENIFRRLVNSHEKHMGKDNPKTIMHMQSLADTLCSMNNPSKWKEATEIYKACIESTKRINNGDDSGGLLTVQYINKLAAVLLKEKNYPEAKKHVSLSAGFQLLYFCSGVG